MSYVIFSPFPIVSTWKCLMIEPLIVSLPWRTAISQVEFTPLADMVTFIFQ
jgi:hypothetical protein